MFTEKPNRRVFCAGLLLILAGFSPNATFGIVTTQRNNQRDIQFGTKFTF
jgi:hypothetical protein